MGKQILEGLWDCPYCKSTAIGGLTKHCPCCGHPQDDGTKFYMGTAKKYLDADLAAQYGQGADWVCPYCGSLNRVHFKYCTNCAAPKEEAQKDYFSSESEPQPVKASQPAAKPRPARRILPLLIILAIILAGVVALRPRTVQSTITDTQWSRAIQVETEKTVQESGWNVPAGARVYNQNTEIHHYEPVFDHYETRTRQVAEDVYDGEDIHTNYVNNGDGTFTEETYTTPRYRTEYRTETYKEPVYRQEPVYATKYYYDIERWFADRTEQSGGHEDEPCWPEFTLAENERESGRSEYYALTITDAKEHVYTVYLPQDRWKNYRIGDAVSITVSGSRISELDNVPVN